MCMKFPLGELVRKSWTPSTRLNAWFYRSGMGLGVCGVRSSRSGFVAERWRMCSEKFWLRGSERHLVCISGVQSLILEFLIYFSTPDLSRMMSSFLAEINLMLTFLFLNPDAITGCWLHERIEMVVKMSEDEYWYVEIFQFNTTIMKQKSLLNQ